MGLTSNTICQSIWGDKWLLRKVPTSLYKCDFILYSKCPRTLQQKWAIRWAPPMNSILCLAIGQPGKITFLVLSGAPLTRLVSLNRAEHTVFQPNGRLKGCPPAFAEAVPCHHGRCPCCSRFLSYLRLSAFPALLKCRLLLEALRDHPFSPILISCLCLELSSLFQLDKCSLNAWVRNVCRPRNNPEVQAQLIISYVTYNLTPCLSFPNAKRVDRWVRH